MTAWITRSQWGWSLHVADGPDGLVASANHADSLWPLAQSLDLELTA